MSTNASSDLPPFLYGTFDWRINGLVIEHVVPIDLTARSALQDDNPWVVLAAVMERAKRGDHGYGHVLQALSAQTVPTLDRIALLLLGMVALEEEISIIEDVLAGPDALRRVYASAAARQLGQLKLVPAMLSAWQRSEHPRERASIAHHICDMLEPPNGPLLEASELYDLPKTDPQTLRNPAVRAFAELRNARPPVEERFSDLVNERLRELAETLDARTCLWAGQQRDPRTLARAFWQALPGASSALDLLHYRTTFEATTGVACDDFFAWDRPRRLVIQANLEAFLDTPSAVFEPGRRHFWGHPMP